MTITHDCSEDLKKADLKVTPARIATMQLFESHEKPLDAGHLAEHLTKEGIDRVTVFRILKSFVDKGLIRKLEFREGKTRYELNNDDHHHFVCSDCGKVEDIGKDTIMKDYIEKIEDKYGFKVSEHALEFFGLCEECQKGFN